jgi:chitinase
MVLSQTTRCLFLALACAWGAGCSNSKTTTPVANDTPAPASGGNGATAGSGAIGGGSDSGGSGSSGSSNGGGSTTPAGGSDGGTTSPSDGGTTSPSDGGTTTTPPTTTVAHHRCGWMNDDIALGKASFVANADFFDAIHPYWWTLGNNGTVSATSWVDDATVVSTSTTHKIKLMPLVYGGDDASLIRAVFATPASITAHVSTLVNLAVTHHYDGIELDYEHLWSGSDRPGYTALVTQLAAGLHAQGKELSLAVPAIDVDNPKLDGYDYKAIVAGGVDVVHLMGYDFHGDFSDHLGPLAPLGWIDAVNARVQNAGLGSHFLLGIGNYGIGLGWYANSADAIKMCGTSYATTTTHMATCPYGVYAPGVAPHCTTSKGDIWFEDAASMAEKANSAKAHGLRGVSYYTLGGEPAGLFTSMRAAYP